MGTCLNKHTAFLALLVTVLAQCFVTAKPGGRTRDNMVAPSHHKGKRGWDGLYSPDTQDEPVLSIVEETNPEVEVGDEPSVDTMWLDISKDFRDTAQISKYSEGELECEAVGSPPPKVFWLRNGIPIESMTIVTNADTIKNRIEIGNNNVIYDKFARSGMANVKARLPLRCAVPEDEGHYTCVAVNRGKQVTATTYVTVIDEDPSTPRGSCEYRLSSMSFKKSKKGSSAFILNSETFHMETMGKHVSLPCRPIGKPRPHVTWFDQEGKKIISGKKYQVSSSGSLVIRNLAWKDMGVYTCSAENVVGKDTTTTFVYPLSDESDDS